MTGASAKKTFVIIDSNAVVHRSYHALPPLTSPKGELVQAVYGYASLLLKGMRELQPEYVAAAFDLAGPTFRHKAYSAYKATRAKAPDELYAQIPMVKSMLKAFRIPVLEKQGFEADDVIGAVAKRIAEKKDMACIIVTGDLDTLQLVNARTSVYTLKSGLKEAFIYNETRVRERYGLSPEQLPDFKGLKGDPSDNIPGVPGIGDKTASALLQKFGTLEKLYEELERRIKNVESGVKKKHENDKKAKSDKPKAVHWEKPLTEKLASLLVEYRDQAFFSKELATINVDMPLDFSLQDASRESFNRDDVVMFFKELGFLSLIGRLSDSSTDGPIQPDAAQAPGMQNKKHETEPGERASSAKIIDEAFLTQALNRREPFFFYVCTETLLGTTVPTLLALGQGDDVRHGEFAKAVLLPSCRELFARADIEKITHGAKAHSTLLRKYGMVLCGIAHDTEIAYLLTRPQSKDASLATAVLQEFGEEWRMRGEAATDAAYIVAYLKRLHTLLIGKIAAQGLAEVYRDIELPLVPVLAHMEELGICIDRKKLGALSQQFKRELAKLEKEIHALAGTAFNVNSTKELREVLFKKMDLGVKGLRKTAGGVTSTKASELDKLKGAHPVIEKILSYREFFKLKTTYLDTLPLLADAGGRVHTTYMQLGAATGRMASQDPNLQNIPIRGDWGKQMRSMFVAEEGFMLLAADYSQLELRIAAHLSHDPVMIEAFANGQDIHTRTAAAIFGVALTEVTVQMRSRAKTLNFGVLYGMGPQAFSETASVTPEEARKFIENYFKEFSVLYGYLEGLKMHAAAQGYVETAFGRRRYIPELRSSNFAVRRAGERMAINMPIQGTEADIVKIAMVRIAGKLSAEYSDDRARMLLQVHDELVFEVRNAILKDVAALVKREMESVYALDSRLIAECKAGDSWGDMRAVP